MSIVVPLKHWVRPRWVNSNGASKVICRPSEDTPSVPSRTVPPSFHFCCPVPSRGGTGRDGTGRDGIGPASRGALAFMMRRFSHSCWLNRSPVVAMTISLLKGQSTGSSKVIVDEPLTAVSPNRVQVFTIACPCISRVPWRIAKTFAPSERQSNRIPTEPKSMLLTKRYFDRAQIAVERHRRSMLKRLRCRPDLQSTTVEGVGGWGWGCVGGCRWVYIREWFKADSYDTFRLWQKSRHQVWLEPLLH